jgi:hypothetical protein
MVLEESSFDRSVVSASIDDRLCDSFVQRTDDRSIDRTNNKIKRIARTKDGQFLSEPKSTSNISSSIDFLC